jgi:hypothetical protein
MSKIKQLQNWRSTLAGLAMILSALAHVHTFADFTKAEVYGPIAGGIGLIVSADAKKADNNNGNSTPQ